MICGQHFKQAPENSFKGTTYTVIWRLWFWVLLASEQPTPPVNLAYAGND